jgi:RNA polymerase sigma-70 factor (ECF subfamily)
MRQELAGKVREAVNRLPAEQRFVVERRIDSDQTFAEIAAELNVPLGTVLTRMRLALAKLKLVLEPEARDTRETH